MTNSNQEKSIYNHGKIAENIAVFMLVLTVMATAVCLYNFSGSREYVNYQAVTMILGGALLNIGVWYGVLCAGLILQKLDKASSE